MKFMKTPGKAMWYEVEELRKDTYVRYYTIERYGLEPGDDPLLLFISPPHKSITLKDLQIVELEPTLLLETADVDGSKESILAWVDKYGFPSWPKMHRDSFKLTSGVRILFYLFLTELRLIFANVSAAAILWRGLVERDISTIRTHLKCEDNVLVVNLKYDHGEIKVPTEVKIEVSEFEAILSEQNTESLLSKSAEVLAWLINYWLYDFSPQTSVKVKYHKDDEEEVIGFETMFDGIEPVSFIWITLKNMLCDSTWNKWRFKKCEKCNIWIHLIPPTHHKNRRMCDDCAAQHEKEENNRRAKESQQKHYKKN